MDIAHSTALQLLVVLAIPAALGAIVWAGVCAHRWFERRRTAATRLSVDLTLRGTSPLQSGDGDGPQVRETLADLLAPD
jgi:hypothetical protein